MDSLGLCELILLLVLVAVWVASITPVKPSQWICSLGSGDAIRVYLLLGGLLGLRGFSLLCQCGSTRIGMLPHPSPTSYAFNLFWLWGYSAPIQS